MVRVFCLRVLVVVIQSPMNINIDIAILVIATFVFT